MRRIFKIGAIASALVIILAVAITSVAMAAGPNPNPDPGTCRNPDCVCPNPDCPRDGNQLQYRIQNQNSSQGPNGNTLHYQYRYCQGK